MLGIAVTRKVAEGHDIGGTKDKEKGKGKERERERERERENLWYT